MASRQHQQAGAIDFYQLLAPTVRAPTLSLLGRATALMLLRRLRSKPFSEQRYQRVCTHDVLVSLVSPSAISKARLAAAAQEKWQACSLEHAVFQTPTCRCRRSLVEACAGSAWECRGEW